MGDCDDYEGVGGDVEVSAALLPNSWRIGCLGDVAAKVPNAIVDGPFGSNLKLSDYVDSGVPVLQGKNITNDRFRWFDVRFISDSKAEELKRSSVRVGDLLMVKIGSIGYSAVVDSLAGHDFAVIPANLAKVTPDLNLVDRKYLHHWLTSPETKRYLLANASKTAQPALSLGKIRALPIPIPPLEEQRRIAAILDQGETLRTQRRQALAHLDTLTQSLFLDMFGDPVVNPKGFETCLLGDIIEFVGGSQPAKEHFTFEPSPDSIRLVQIRDFRTDEFKTYIPRKLAKRLLEVDDVMIGRYGPPVFQIFRGLSGSYNVALMKALPKTGVLRDFIFFLLQEPGLHGYVVDRSTRTAGQSGVNLDLLENYPAFKPPEALQQTFATRIQAIEALKATHRTALAQLDALFASLQQRAFAGEL